MKRVTRQELSSVISRLRGENVSVTQVRRNEVRWGLKAARGVDLNKRTVRYDLTSALRALADFGVIPRPGAAVPDYPRPGAAVPDYPRPGAAVPDYPRPGAAVPD